MRDGLGSVARVARQLADLSRISCRITDGASRCLGSTPAVKCTATTRHIWGEQCSESGAGSPARSESAEFSGLHGYGLVYPVYLDIPMMISFLAHLEGGYSTHEEQKKTVADARERALKASAGVRARIPLLGSANASGEGTGSRRSENTVESSTERHHTFASLFNILYEYLQQPGQMQLLTSAAQLDELRSGELVEIKAEYLGNPIEDILRFFTALFPYFAESKDALSTMEQHAGAGALNEFLSATGAVNADEGAGDVPVELDLDDPDVKNAIEVLGQLQTLISGGGVAGNVGASGVPNQEDLGALNIRLFLRMAQDMQSAPVHDLLLRTADGLRIVAAVSSEHYPPATSEFLRAGEFRLVGKVTRILKQAETINLSRRAVLGSSMTDELIKLANNDDFSLNVADPIVEAPAVQVLPMAIFV